MIHRIFFSFGIRCVVMVGLPYPNIYSPELKEKMTYLDATLGVRFFPCFEKKKVPYFVLITLVRIAVAK